MPITLSHPHAELNKGVASKQPMGLKVVESSKKQPSDL